MVLPVIAGVGVVGWIGFFIFAYKLWQWEYLLRYSRVQVRYKGRARMTPRLLDWLVWANRLKSDKQVSGQTVYAQGGTTISIMRPLPRDHNKTTHRIIKPKKAAA
jgi:hypothetical protein